MVVDESAQIYLRNLLQKSRKGMECLKAEVDTRGKEIQQLSGRWDAVKLDESQAQKEVDTIRVWLRPLQVVVRLRLTRQGTSLLARTNITPCVQAPYLPC